MAAAASMALAALALHLTGARLAAHIRDPVLSPIRLELADPPQRPEGLPAVPPRTYVAVDGIPFLARDANTPWPTASTGKIMTAYTVLADPSLPLRRVLTIDRKDVAEEMQGYQNGDSEVPLALGQRYTVEQLLYALMLPSADDAADVLAEHSAGHMAGFLREMNALARRLQLQGAHFTDPSGAAPSNVATARDLVVLAEHALENPVFAKVVATRTYTLPHVGRIGNLNWMLWNVDGAVGVKTGWTSAAGHSLVFAVRRPVAGEDVLVVGAVLGMDRQGPSFTPLFHKARALVEATFRNLTVVHVTPGVVGQVAWAEGLRLPASVPVGWRAVLPAGTHVTVRWRLLHPEPVQHTLTVALATVLANGVPVATLPVVSPAPPPWYRSLYALARFLQAL